MGWNLPGRSSLSLLIISLSALLGAQESFIPLEVSTLRPAFLFTDHKELFFPLPPEASVEESLEQYNTQWAKTYLSQVEERSRPYRYNLSYMLWETEQPLELINLPVIESGWDPRSLSSSGAFGIWQFMKNSIPPSFVDNRWRDDRGDPILSTEAAISKFRFNLAKTEGDWLLALAGYNCGINHIIRSLEKSSGKDYWALRQEGLLPEQTVHYIPRFLAVNYILNHKVEQGVPLNWEKSPYWLSLPLRERQFLPALAASLEMDQELLIAGNAALKDWITPPLEEAYKIKIPLDKLEGFTRLGQSGVIPLAETADSRDNELLGNKNSPLYLVQEGDTIWKIAVEFQCTPESLIEKNGLPDPDSLVPGMLLFLP